MNSQPAAVIDGMSASEIEITDDPTPGGLSNSLRLVVWVNHDDSDEKMGAAARTVTLRLDER